VISVIFPVFNEQDNLDKLYDTLNQVVNKVPRIKFEFIFVDDCSTDRSPEILQKLNAKDERVKIIRFSRNFGSHTALSAGFHHSKGDCAIVLASDLQDPPDLILKLVEKWERGSKVVWAVRSKREGESFSTKIFSKLYNFLLNILTDIKVPPLGTDVFLADRIVIDAYKNVVEKHSSIYLIFAWLGFPQDQIEYVKEARYKGKSNWTIGDKFKLVIDSILSFSYLPVRFISILGVMTAFLGFIYASLVFWNFIHGEPVQGWSSLMVTILIVGGIVMIMLGVLGEYLWRTFDESRRRPHYIIEYQIE